MHFSRKLVSALLVLSASIIMTSMSLAADPGPLPPATSEMSDQKAGSVLIFNLVTSDAANYKNHDTSYSITNTNDSPVDGSVFVHMFFVENEHCSIQNYYVCLTQNGTKTFHASDLQPNETGYLVAVAVNSVGCPINFNFLIGDERIKLPSGHTANLAAQSFAALYDGTLPGCDGASFTADLVFDGNVYNRAPRVLAVSSIPSSNDGNDTRLVVNRVGGVFNSSAASIGNIWGILYDERERPHSWTRRDIDCQLYVKLDDTFPATSPRLSSVIPSGESGWMKFWSTSGDFGIVGAVINYNPNHRTVAGAYNDGHNLHALRLSATNTITIPIHSPSC